MFEVDEKDRVVVLQDIPQSSVGAPEPVIIAKEGRVVLAYRVQSSEIWDVETVRIDDEQGKESIALVRLECRAHMFGPPNDEAFSGHPLASRGLHAYGTFTEDMNPNVSTHFSTWYSPSTTQPSSASADSSMFGLSVEYWSQMSSRRCSRY